MYSYKKLYKKLNKNKNGQNHQKNQSQSYTNALKRSFVYQKTNITKISAITEIIITEINNN